MDNDSKLRSLILRGALHGLVVASLAGCANLLPERASVPEEHALVGFADTTLFRATAGELANPDGCGLRPLPVASYALAARLELARRAERTLDVQYYVLRDDKSGLTFMRALRDAARRGVRVRVIIDDMHTDGEDAALSGLNAEPNVEVRLYNPIATWRRTSFGRNLGALPEIQRLDHRMHNKLFVADNAAAIFGGRNLADEYFMRSDESNFVDLDMFVVGAPVREFSDAFDAFWNSPIVFPLAQVLQPTLPADRARDEFDQRTRDIRLPAPEKLPEQYRRFTTLPTEIAEGHIGHLMSAQCRVVADAPKKFEKVDDPGFPTVMRAVLNMLSSAQTEAEIVSPYFVPGDYGMRLIHEGKLRGGHTLVITNSLASTDSPAAQSGYMRYRKAMLREHVTLRELSPLLTTTRRRLGIFGNSLGRLHAKAVLVDRHRLFLGSMNLDFRSAYRNTEIGMIIDSATLGEQLSALVDEESFYELRLNESDEIEWTQRLEDGSTQVFDADPETTWWDRLWPVILGPLIPEKEL
jgi:putative cardiolipin synthase